MGTKWGAVALVVTIGLSAGCSSLRVGSDYPDSGSQGHPYPSEPERRGEGRHEHAIEIPKGHYPPPGACRIWYPGVEPGQQPPPGDCQELSHRVPAGAWLISRDRNNSELASVSVYDARRPQVVIDVQWFEAATGRRVQR